MNRPWRARRGAHVFVLLLLTSPLSFSVQAVDYYVDDDAPTGHAGTSWGRAFQHLQDAVLTARDGDVIHVAEGVYEPDLSEAHPEWVGDRTLSFSLSESVQILGGYAGILAADPDERDPALYPTVLSGDLLNNDGGLLNPQDVDESDPLRIDNSLVVIAVYQERAGVPVDVTLEGVTIQSGFHPRDESSGLLGVGAGLACTSLGEVTVTVRDVSLRGNYAGATGAGVFNAGAAILMRASVIEGNVSRIGAGYAASEGPPGTASGLDASGCVFEGNQLITSDAGELVWGAAYASSSEKSFAITHVRECLFLENSAETQFGAGRGVVYLGAHTQARFENNTFKDNSAEFVHGGATFYIDSDLIVLNFLNNVCWGATPNVNHMRYPAGGIGRVGFNDIQDLLSNAPPVVMDAGGNFEAAPDFQDSMGRIGGDSACIDAGINRFAESKWDFDGEDRILDDPFSNASGMGGPNDNSTPGTPGLRPIVDVGAFEYFRDCNDNGVLDTEDISSGTSEDCNSNGVPDECEDLGDCNGNGLPDECEVLQGLSEDCNANLVPDECEFPEGDQDHNGVLDDCELPCVEFEQTRALIALDTITLLTNADNPELEAGYVYVHAVDAESDPIAFDHLIGQVLIVDGIDSFEYTVNAVDFRSGVEPSERTDVDKDGHLDLNGVEYEMAPNELLVPRFWGQDESSTALGVSSELVLIGLSGGAEFRTTVDFQVYNDNGEAFSTEHTFRCWEKVSLSAISGVFSSEFLRDFTNHDPSEVLGAPSIEAGWFRMQGGVANSDAAQILDPAVYAVLIERSATVRVADLPFEIGGRAGHLLPHDLEGDNEEAGGVNFHDPSVNTRRRRPGSLLLFPEFDNRDGAVSVLSVTNTSQEGVSVHFVYVGRLTQL